MCSSSIRGQDSLEKSYDYKFQAGLCLKKFAGFYWMNGLSVSYHLKGSPWSHLRTGAVLSSSRFGSAFTSNAILVHALECFAHYSFRDGKQLQPFLGLNIGYAHANYGSDKYKSLPNSQALLSPETGLYLRSKYPLSIAASLGYNLITGDGTKNLGLIYPVFFQFRFLYVFE